ncbi:MAG: hypothetical protein CYPHOPRED_005016 [Cyphobasidiales sp. Tagirdzhanova-0007]|nr:MAG: hypothetical protein CYPHOPRED_005016 [Cyphobasidiales sp. Tagirdzhanova-0007]
MDELSVTEKAKIELAIALSLGKPVPSKSLPTQTRPDHDGPIVISDSSSPEPQAAATATNFANQAKDDSDTEISEVEETDDGSKIRVGTRKRKDRTPDTPPPPERSRSQSKRSRPASVDNSSIDVAKTANQSSFGKYTRAEMERDRLARQAARQASISSFSSAPSAPSGMLRGNPVASSSNPTKDRLNRIATLASLAPSPSKTSSSLDSATVKTNSGPLFMPEHASQAMHFWNGIIRPTASYRHSGYECFTFKDVIGDTDDLESALLTTFCGEPEWIHSQFPSHVRIALVMPCASHGNPEVTQVTQNMKLINPQRDSLSKGCMHIKLMLLYHTTYLRVAVATANFIEYDWSTIENAVYVHDFPFLNSPLPTVSAFRETLLRTHRSLGTPYGLYADALEKYDYSTATGIRLILSVPGNHRGPATLQSTGHTGLAKALQDLKLFTPFKGAHLSMECHGSSIGSYTHDWLRSFYRSALGWDPPSLSANSLKTESARVKIAWKEDEWPDVKIIYPTFRTVKESLGGPAGGGTMFCPLDQWRKPKFPRALFYDSKSLRTGLLQHTKMILGIIHPAGPQSTSPFQNHVKEVEPSQEAFKPYGWLYIGSHNYTPAAWGRYNSKNGNLSISNHELGVVIPLREDDVEAQANRLVTWKRPLAKFGKDDTPWDQFQYRRGQTGVSEF